MDIEGYEQKVLSSSKNILLRDNIRFVIATYHKTEDMDFIEAYMQKYGFKTEQSEGLLWIDHKVFGADPFGSFRKAMLRASKVKK